MGADPGAPDDGVLIVTAHPDPESLTRAIAARLGALIGSTRSVMADLTDDGFDPTFSLADREAYLGHGAAPADVVAEQERIEAAADLVLVFPVHWWSLPAQLKGWIDRVFISGWAFDIGDGGTVVPRLDRLRIHLIPVASTSAASFERHGYSAAFTAQIEHGVVEYCGARRGATVFVHDSESADRELVSDAVDRAVATVVQAVRRR